MCGIVALYDPAGGLVAADLDPIEVLRHRGPDGVTRWVSPCGRVALAHARLAIIAPDNGAQPVRDCTGHVHAVVNGEFYDHRRLRADLRRAGHGLRTDADSEIVVHAYEQDPEGFVKLLRGEFAVVLWDDRAGRLVAVRDRFGVKPLFHADLGGRLIIASEAKALFAAGVPAAWHLQNLHDQLTAAMGPRATLFAGIEQIPPGAILQRGATGTRTRRYWLPDFPMRGDAVEPPTGDEMREALDEAVGLRLAADRPVAIYLSGGLDSSLIASAAAEHAQQHTFTVRFADDPHDESAIAARTAHRIGARHCVIEIDGDRIRRLTHEAVTAGEMLQENGHAGARLAQARAIADAGFRVALAGEGGDEVFVGYPQSQHDLLHDLDPAAAQSTQRSMKRLASSGASPTLAAIDAELGFVPGWLLDRVMVAGGPVRQVLRHDFLAAHAARPALVDTVAELADQLRGRSAVHRSTLLFLNSWFPNYLLAAERLDMAAAVEVRLPLLDHHLFDVARRVAPADLAARDGLTKAWLRTRLSDRVTPEVRSTAKHPFSAPDHGWADAALAVADQLSDGVFDGHPVVDAAATGRLLEDLQHTPDRGAGCGPVLNIVASIGCLERSYSPGHAA